VIGQLDDDEIRAEINKSEVFGAVKLGKILDHQTNLSQSSFTYLLAGYENYDIQVTKLADIRDFFHGTSG
jgi:hypothetical protein